MSAVILWSWAILLTAGVVIYASWLHRSSR